MYQWLLVNDRRLISTSLLQPPLLGHGQGRLSVLNQPVTVATAIQKMKSHLGLTHLRLALGVGKTLGNAFLPLCVALHVSQCDTGTFCN